jgi:hypothetical protein
MADVLAYTYAAIEKADKNDDGTLTVYGKATDDSIDIDQQICDDEWLKRAMPDWFTTGGNVREQHSNIAAGVATDYELKSDGHYITALVVDPTSVKKVEAGVLKGFSIGIRGPRVIRDTKAAGGRIVDGQIIEISLVDRPANPNAKLILAKSVDGDLVKFDDAQERDDHGRWTSGAGSDSGVTAEPATGSGAPGVAGQTGGSVPSYVQEGSNNGTAKVDGARASAAIASMRDAVDKYRSAGVSDGILSRATSALDNAEQAHREGNSDAARSYFDSAHNTLTMGINANNFEVGNTGSQVTQAAIDHSSSIVYGAPNDSASVSSGFVVPPIRSAGKSTIPTPKDVARMVNKNTEPVEEEAVVVEEPTEEVIEEVVIEEVDTQPIEIDESEKAAALLNVTKSFIADLNKFDKDTYDRARKELSNLIIVEANEMADEGHDERESIEELLGAVKHLFRWYEGEAENGEVSNATVMPEGRIEEIMLSAEMDKADMADGGCDHDCEDCAAGKGCADKSCKCDTADISAGKSVEIDDATTVAIIEKAVEQAKKSVIDEIDLLKSALQAATVEQDRLADELATAKKAAVAGGPKRSVITKAQHDVNALRQKAAEYQLKSAATTDPVLAQGYRDLASELNEKASKEMNPNG